MDTPHPVSSAKLSIKCQVRSSSHTQGNNIYNNNHAYSIFEYGYLYGIRHCFKLPCIGYSTPWYLCLRV